MILFMQIFLVATVAVMSFAFGFYFAYFMARKEIARIRDGISQIDRNIETSFAKRDAYRARALAAEARVAELEAAK